MIVDTSVLVESLTGPMRLSPVLRRVLSRGERLVVPTIVLFEWWRGPRTEAELRTQETIFPRNAAPAFGHTEAAIAARLYRQMSRPRGREIDLAIAACAISRELPLWTLNRKDFAGIPGVTLANLD